MFILRSVRSEMAWRTKRWGTSSTVWTSSFSKSLSLERSLDILPFPKFPPPYIKRQSCIRLPDTFLNKVLNL